MSEIIIFEHSTLKYNIIYWLHNALAIFILFLVHPCDKPNKGGCGQICNKRKEWHVCSCKTGFVLGRDNKTCNKGEWINNSTLRIYVQLDFYNKCDLYWLLFFVVHPCDTIGNAGCSQICNKKKQKYECACEEGYVLGKDRRTCYTG